MPYQHHSPEEKLWAAKTFTETEQSAKEVAAQLNMTCSTAVNQIYAWARKYRQDGEEAFKENKRTASPEKTAYIKESLKEFYLGSYNKTAYCEMKGISRPTLYNWIRKHGQEVKDEIVREGHLITFEDAGSNESVAEKTTRQMKQINKQAASQDNLSSESLFQKALSSIGPAFQSQAQPCEPIIQAQSLSSAPLFQTQGQPWVPLFQTLGLSQEPEIWTSDLSIAPLFQTNNLRGAPLIWNEVASDRPFSQTLRLDDRPGPLPSKSKPSGRNAPVLKRKRTGLPYEKTEPETSSTLPEAQNSPLKGRESSLPHSKSSCPSFYNRDEEVTWMSFKEKSSDLRDKVIEDYRSGLSFEQIAELNETDTREVRRLIRKYEREHGPVFEIVDVQDDPDLRKAEIDTLSDEKLREQLLAAEQKLREQEELNHKQALAFKKEKSELLKEGRTKDKEIKELKETIRKKDVFIEAQKKTSLLIKSFSRDFQKKQRPISIKNSSSS